MNPADVAHAALLEAGRPDLAELVHVFENEDGSPYLEYWDDDLPSDNDRRLMNKAQEIMVEWHWGRRS